MTESLTCQDKVLNYFLIKEFREYNLKTEIDLHIVVRFEDTLDDKYTDTIINYEVYINGITWKRLDNSYASPKVVENFKYHCDDYYYLIPGYDIKQKLTAVDRAILGSYIMDHLDD
jgi:hypothetical protein